jgi:hypothetical protein
MEKRQIDRSSEERDSTSRPTKQARIEDMLYSTTNTPRAEASTSQETAERVSPSRTSHGSRIEDMLYSRASPSRRESHAQPEESIRPESSTRTEVLPAPPESSTQTETVEQRNERLSTNRQEYVQRQQNHMAAHEHEDDFDEVEEIESFQQTEEVNYLSREIMRRGLADGRGGIDIDRIDPEKLGEINAEFSFISGDVELTDLDDIKGASKGMYIFRRHQKELGIEPVGRGEVWEGFAMNSTIPSLINMGFMMTMSTFLIFFTTQWRMKDHPYRITDNYTVKTTRT